MKARKITLVIALVLLGLILVGCERQQIRQITPIPVVS